MTRCSDSDSDVTAALREMTPPSRAMDLPQAAAYTPPVEHNTAEGGATE